MRVLVTGASGFVGNSLCSYLVAKNFFVIGVVRSMPKKPLHGVDYHVIEGLNIDAKWCGILVGVEAVIHCAARAHIMRDTEEDPLEVFREINVQGTICIAQQAADNGVKRFVYLSSIKVNGENTDEHPFKADDPPAPKDPYGISKWEAEIALKKISHKTKLEIVIIRPPLVYGPMVRANFQALMKMIDLGIPLPLGSINNRRSLVALDNLISLIDACINNPAAIGQTFLVSDDDDVSTTELLKKVANAMGQPARLFPVPEKLLWSGAQFLGKKNLAQRICGSLQLDISKTKALLGWLPRVSMDEALLQTSKAYRGS